MFTEFRIAGLARLALLITSGTALMSQAVTGQIGGVVTTNGKALSDATVVIRAPQLIQPRTLRTDANGEFRAPLLPPGDYVITVSKSGFVGGEARGVRLGMGGSLRQNFELKAVATAAATVEVVASSTTADKADTKVSTNFSSDTLTSLPTAGGDRSFTGAADLAPGVVAASGGGFAIRGGKTQDSQYTVNGTNITDDYEGNNNGRFLIDDAVEDTQVVQSLLHARYGRSGGGLVNVVTKSGSNTFAGSLRTYVTRQDWSARRPYEVEANADKYSQRQYDLFFSGPIVKDRIWFALSGIKVPPVSGTELILHGQTPSQWTYGGYNGIGPNAAGIDPTFNDNVSMFPYDHNKTVQVTSDEQFVQGKLTVAVNPEHTFELSYSDNKSETKNRNPYGSPIVATLGSMSYSQQSTSKFLNINYRGIITPKLFIEAKYGKKDSSADFPKPPLEHVRLVLSYENEGVLFPYGFNTSPITDKRNNKSGEVNLRYYLDASGNHEIDFGYNFYESVRQTSAPSGPNYRRFWAYATTGDPSAVAGLAADPYGNKVGFLAVNWAEAVAAGEQGANPAAGGLAPVYRRYFGRDGITKNRNEALYLNDAWTVNNHWNVMLGLRIDRTTVTDTDGSTLLKQTAPLSPRLAVKFDPVGDNGHVLSFSAAKYIVDVSAGYTDAFIKQGNSRYADYGWTANATGKARWVGYNTLIDPTNYQNPYQFFDSASNNILTKLENPYVYELALGYRRNYVTGSYVSLNLVRKDWHNDFTTIQDFDPSFYVVVADPTGKGLTGKYQMGQKFGNNENVRRSYSALEFEFLEKVNTRFMVGGNYTWSRLTGNNNGGDNASQGFRDNSAAAGAFMWNWLASKGYSESAYRSYGKLLNDQTHRARIYAVANQPVGKGRISYSAIFRFDAGKAFDITQSANLGAPTPTPTTVIDGKTVSLAGAPTKWTYFAAQRGSFTYNNTYQVDAKIDWQFPIYKGLQLMGNLQVNNVFNHQMQSGYLSTMSATTMGNPVKVGNVATFGTDNNNYANYIYGRSATANIGLKF